MIVIESFTGDHVYLDVNIFIYAVEGFPKYSKLCADILQSIEDMKIHAVTSELTLAEVLARPFKDNESGIISVYQDLVRTQFDLKVVPISREILIDAASLRARFGDGRCQGNEGSVSVALPYS